LVEGNVIFYGTLDVSKRSQISLIIRNIDEITIRGDFMTFVDAFDEAWFIQLKKEKKLSGDE